MPCSDHGPMQTQQNSCLHFLHVIWLHPPFFSIVDKHLLHSFVLLLIQFAVSLSSWHFFIHNRATEHTTGRWSPSIAQPKQNLCSLPASERLPCFPHSCASAKPSVITPQAPHETVGTTVIRLEREAAAGQATVFVHPG